MLGCVAPHSVPMFKLNFQARISQVSVATLGGYERGSEHHHNNHNHRRCRGHQDGPGGEGCRTGTSKRLHRG